MRRWVLMLLVAWLTAAAPSAPAAQEPPGESPEPPRPRGDERTVPRPHGTVRPGTGPRD